MKKILVVDDNIAMGRSVRDTIIALGYDTVLCGAGAAAVPLISIADVLITDFQMPGVNGAMLAKEAKRQKPNMPVAIMSGDVSEIPKDHQADKLLEKPFHMLELKGWLDQIG